MGDCISVKSVAELLALPTEGLESGTAAVVAGYYEPLDGGQKTLYYQADCTLPENGGTVHMPESGVGRWLYRDSVGHYGLFGVLGTEQNADEALEAMCADPQIKRIEARSDLNFAKRHKLYRSNITLDFQGHSVSTKGCELSQTESPYDPFSAIFYFSGKKVGEPFELTLTERWKELNDIYFVGDSSRFAVGEWYVIHCDKRKGGAEMELDKLLEVTEIIDETHIRLNYKNGWELKEGGVITFWKCEPVQNVKVQNMRFYATVGGLREGTAPLAFEFAVRCDIDHIYSQDNFWPLCIRRHNTHFLVEACELINPCEVVIGGTGYLAQNLNSLYGCVRDCHVSNARHLNDFTASAYCMVENCHGDGDWCGTYVTHGQYEHDLTYVGCSGLLSFANSGPTWGESAKRITVMRHSASRVIAMTHVSDLTLIDVQAYKREEAKDYRNEAYEFDTGTFFVNCDGLQMRGCTAEGGIKFTNRSSRSRRRNLLDGCAFHQPAGYGTKVYEDTPEVERVDFINCDFYGCGAEEIEGIKSPKYINTEFYKEED